MFNGYFDVADLRQVVEWFDMGGTLQVSDTTPAESTRGRRPRRIEGLRDRRRSELGLTTHASTPALASAIDFVLEGLYAQKKISRNDDWKYSAERIAAARASARETARCPSRALPPSGKKKYYN